MDEGQGGKEGFFDFSKKSAVREKYYFYMLLTLHPN